MVVPLYESLINEFYYEIEKAINNMAHGLRASIVTVPTKMIAVERIVLATITWHMWFFIYKKWLKIKNIEKRNGNSNIAVTLKMAMWNISSILIAVTLEICSST